MMERWDRIGRAAAYGIVAALVPYLVIKVSWVVGSLLGLLPVGRGFSLGGWLVLNTVTIGMAAAGITLGLALVRPWGMRIPGWLVGFFAWVGSGFLVSILPFVVVSALVNSGTGSSGGSGSPGVTRRCRAGKRCCSSAASWEPGLRWLSRFPPICGGVGPTCCAGRSDPAPAPPQDRCGPR